MTQKTREGGGGSTVVKSDGAVEHTAGTLNPDDKGYREAVKKVPVHNEQEKGTVNRLPSYRDLDEHAAADRERAKKTTKTPGATPTQSDTTGGKK